FHLPKILKGEVVWCQGFSEPGAGSDLASLRTRAVIEGDELVVNGQKIWTSYAHLAQYQELLVRTDTDAPKHKGISWVVCDMNSPGITIRKIQTMAGHGHFCEVFYDDVRIPLKNVVGEINDGWSVAMSTMSFERGTAFMAEQIELARKVERMIDLAKDVTGPDGKRPAIKDDEIARRLGILRAEVSSLRAMTFAGVSRAIRTGSPGAEGSMIRLFFTKLQQKAARLSMDIQGPSCLDISKGELGWSQPYLRAYAGTIAGGAEQIQKEIIGERVLGLPRNR
ncbi:MAG: acyl-CoA dehydrogenase family protein, partial [Kordiimonadaceae bacterium]|nr:acyl-CoA dehydrogenase family protein [Kordiimonadaceae bacterium]